MDQRATVCMFLLVLLSSPEILIFFNANWNFNNLLLVYGFNCHLYADNLKTHYRYARSFYSYLNIQVCIELLHQT